LAANQPPHRPTQPGAALTLLVGVSLVASGLGSWLARPENRLGPVMVLTAFAWFASQLTEASSPTLYTFGTAVQYLFIAGFVYVLLSFPSGRLSGSLDRALVALAVAVGGGLQVLAMFFGNKVGLRCSACPDNVLQTFHDNFVASRLLDWLRVLGGVLLVTLIGIVANRWWRATAAQRREVAPVLIAGCVTLLALTATIVDDLVGDPLGSLPANVFFYTAAAVPVAVLVVFLRRRLARGMVAGLVVQLGEPHTPLNLREALARALGDPSLELAFWFPAESRYVSGHGDPVQLPGPGAGRRATFVERDGQPIALLLHDPVLEHNAELVRSVCAAAGLALENERLQAELRARLAELQASRARLVEATDAERRRIERNLHDGTQQRLVSIGMSLGLLEAKLPAQTAEAQPLLHETRAALALALQELRELTHGINPPLLTERGLAAALEELCRQAALPTRLEVALDERPSTQVETAVYFLSSEALANAAKHSHATEVSVSVSRDADRLVVEVTDDGIGGATAVGGSGLRGLADRIEALGGRFTVSSPPGRGTTLQAEIPCA
jgi:signal transduction histidine kinase